MLPYVFPFFNNYVTIWMTLNWGGEGLALCLSLSLILHHKYFPSSLIQATFNLVIKPIKISSKRELKSFKYPIVKMYHNLSTLSPLLGFKLCLIFATVNKQYHHEIL